MQLIGWLDIPSGHINSKWAAVRQMNETKGPIAAVLSTIDRIQHERPWICGDGKDLIPLKTFLNAWIHDHIKRPLILLAFGHNNEI
jgi:hypothetical protein